MSADFITADTFIFGSIKFTNANGEISAPTNERHNSGCSRQSVAKNKKRNGNKKNLIDYSTGNPSRFAPGGMVQGWSFLLLKEEEKKT